MNLASDVPPSVPNSNWLFLPEISEIDLLINSLRYPGFVIKDSALACIVKEQLASLISLKTAFENLDSLLIYRNKLFIDWALVGYSVSKYKVYGEDSKYLYTRMCFAKEYTDIYVAYGETYRYEIRPIYIKTINPEEKSVIFISSDESSYMTGSELVIDGGITAQ